MPALAAAQARRKRLGTPQDPVGAVKRMGRALKAKTNQFVAKILPVIREIQSAGHTSCNAIARQSTPERLRLLAEAVMIRLIGAGT